MPKISLIVVILTLFLAACAGQTNVTVEPLATQLPEVAQPQATQPLAESTQSEPTEAIATEAAVNTEAPIAAVTVLKIVPGESELKYEVGEVFINQNNRFNVAVGVTRQISGEITIDRENPLNSSLASLNADISQFTSDSARRDNALRDRFIESARYPNVTFEINQIEGLPDNYNEGKEIQFQINGNLTIRETTQPVTFETIAKLEGDTLTSQATTSILMSDFGFGPIDIAGILKTEDEVKITLNIVAKP